MKKAVIFTAMDRTYYLEETLKSWSRARGKEGWDFIFSVDASPASVRAVSIIEAYTSSWPSWCKIEIRVQPRNLGVLEHPYQLFHEAFQTYDYVVRAEDDLIVSDDILEYFTWACETFADDTDVATVIGYSDIDFPQGTSMVGKVFGFGPWVFGTWKDRWDQYIGPTWDRDYSTFNGFKGHEAGWDWNLNTRILPKEGKVNIIPDYSRVHNIGVTGTHAQSIEYISSSTFRPTYAPNKIFKLV